ncbi:MAG: 5-formyltetrahydrofolate cyclo-ligase [Planctomycetota bacterium]
MQTLSKESIRKRCLRERRLLSDRRERSEQCCARMISFNEFQEAQCILWYVDLKSELQTRVALQAELRRGERRCIVPFCEGESLGLVEIRRWEDLESGAFGILEPRRELRSHSVAVDEIDVALIPGVAFDSRGGRIGYGKGYYDRLLRNTPSRMLRVGIAFECQIVTQIDLQAHDVRMHRIVTESRAIDCVGRPGVHASDEPC